MVPQSPRQFWGRRARSAKAVRRSAAEAELAALKDEQQQEEAGGEAEPATVDAARQAALRHSVAERAYTQARVARGMNRLPPGVPEAAAAPEKGRRADGYWEWRQSAGGKRSLTDQRRQLGQIYSATPLRLLCVLRDPEGKELARGWANDRTADGNVTLKVQSFGHMYVCHTKRLVLCSEFALDSSPCSQPITRGDQVEVLRAEPCHRHLVEVIRLRVSAARAERASVKAMKVRDTHDPHELTIN